MPRYYARRGEQEEAAMGGIQRLGFVEIGAVDIEETAAFYEKVIGLQTTEQQGSTRYLKCWDEYDHHSLVLHEAQGPGLVQIGWKVESDDALAALEHNVEQWGVATRDRRRRVVRGPIGSDDGALPRRREGRPGGCTAGHHA
jgi:catechol-2,3-dioxygenase